ncbi:DUF1622 domain-containing protein [Pseudoxanthomonas mexicana]|uniref:DUF1622 domain-containing protein n=1 Tax=Pseudoxanthomonas mexicana TaxID=128785 RepID=UPI001FD655B2|nr:DUF1622 domain-containing protein [Pseudoxanthomonas mexicana]UOV05493.1 DUF1622 domain-containing protein [Pseudoxanthomonas mexicana]
MEIVEAIVTDATTLAVLFIEAVVLAVITGATLLATGRMLGLATVPGSARMERSRRIWLDYARWLVAGLTLQIGADILESSIAPTWHAIAQLGAIALIRTFLNYFLERDIREVSELADRHRAAE